MERKFTPVVGEYYHIYNRGVEKRSIAVDDYDREQLLRLLYISNSSKRFVSRELKDQKLVNIDRGEPLVAIGAYCIMPNHFHILAKEIIDGGITKFMLKLTTAYSMHFNRRHTRVGPLFQGRYAISHVEDDRYLKYLYSYIHLNPIKIIDSDWKTTGLGDIISSKDFLENYRYSSLLDYLGAKREERLILNQGEFPEYFSTKKATQAHIDDWLTIRKNT